MTFYNKGILFLYLLTDYELIFKQVIENPRVDHSMKMDVCMVKRKEALTDQPDTTHPVIQMITMVAFYTYAFNYEIQRLSQLQ